MKGRSEWGHSHQVTQGLYYNHVFIHYSHLCYCSALLHCQSFLHVSTYRPETEITGCSAAYIITAHFKNTEHRNLLTEHWALIWCDEMLGLIFSPFSAIFISSVNRSRIVWWLFKSVVTPSLARSTSFDKQLNIVESLQTHTSAFFKGTDRSLLSRPKRSKVIASRRAEASQTVNMWTGEDLRGAAGGHHSVSCELMRNDEKAKPWEYSVSLWKVRCR